MIFLKKGGDVCSQEQKKLARYNCYAQRTIALLADECLKTDGAVHERYGGNPAGCMRLEALPDTFASQDTEYPTCVVLGQTRRVAKHFALVRGRSKRVSALKGTFFRDVASAAFSLSFSRSCPLFLRHSKSAE